MLKEFGTTRTLSSPRLTAVNNQQALLSFSENEVYFSVTYDESTTSGDTPSSTTNISSEVETTPIGIILSLLPSIDLKNSEILMNIRPTITTFLKSVEDPAVALTAATLGDDSGVTSTVPQVAVREIDTVVRIKDGDVIVMGGLIEQKDQQIENGIPVLMDIPLLGYLFKSKVKELQVTETVILLKATIVTPDTKIDKSDRGFLQKFSTDPRPFF
jgi:MSHA biogenesis protein MshL